MRFLLAGTSKGLVKYAISGSELSQPLVLFKGYNVNMLYVDERTDTWWVGVTHKHWGQKLHYSNDQGDTWNEARVPTFGDRLLPSGKPAKLRQLWCMAHAGTDKPGQLWLGTDPGGLFYSTDHGASFQLVESLWNHPSRQKKEQWFGAGSDQPFIHSIIVNPSDSNHVYVAVSSAGIFETKDAGDQWTPRNNGLRATYLPNPGAEVGHDPHTLQISTSDPKVLWQQNHCGVFYTKDGGQQWMDVSKNIDPSYGFAMAIDAQSPENAWVIPVESDELRVAPDLKLKVMHTSDFGSTWSDASKGLPHDMAFDIVLRQAFCKQDKLFAFGTTNGNLYVGVENRQQILWKEISSHLAKVNVLIIH
jgi:photosystem II stability/assembly factor-like uncharacterized protein